MTDTGARIERFADAPDTGARPGWSRLRIALLFAAALVVAGAVYLAITRADALLLDLAALAQCF